MNPTRKYNKHARTDDIVTPTTTRLGDFIYLTFKGTKDSYSFEIPVSEWARITRVKRPRTALRAFAATQNGVDNDHDSDRIGYSTG